MFYTNINKFLFPLTILFFVVTEGVNIAYSRILSKYDKLKDGEDESFGSLPTFWTALGCLLIGYFVFNVARFFFLNLVVLLSNEEIHKNMMGSLLRSPSSYFDVTSTGQLNNNFSNDLGIMDNTLAFILTDAVEGPLICIILLVNVFSINLFFLIPGLLNLFFIIGYFIYCKRPIVEVKKVDLNLKSPVFHMVGEMISGLIQIKILNRRLQLLQQFAVKLNNSFKASISFWNLERAFGVNLNLVAAIVMIVGWVIGIAVIDPDNTALYAVSVVYLIQITEYLQTFMRQIISLESIMVSVERTLNIANLPSEKPLRTDYDEKNQIYSLGEETEEGGKTKQEAKQQKWPERQTIKLENFSMRYRSDLPLVLRKINIQIKEKEKVAIVGRTGAGKSSIIQALFRLYEPEQGSVFKIGDKYDALQMGLHSLRQNIAVIPQTPFLFSGTIRKNLDPFEVHSEEKLWEVLKESNLKSTVEKVLFD